LFSPFLPRCSCPISGRLWLSDWVHPSRTESGIDKFKLFGPLSSAIARAIFGADHLVAAKFVATIDRRGFLDTYSKLTSWASPSLLQL
jgi:hypothetical protein